MTYPDPYYGNTPGTSYYGGQNKMGFGVDDALALGGGIMSGLGAGGTDHFASQQQRNSDVRSLLERVMEFNRTQGLTEGNAATQFQRQIEQSPMRDRLYYNLMARMGLPQQSLSYNNSGYTPVSQANADPAGQYNQAVQNYRPGMGGVDMNQTIQRRMLDNLGYGNANQKTLYDPVPTKGQYAEDWIANYMMGRIGGGGANMPGHYNDTYNAPAQPKAPPVPGSRPLPTGAPGGIGARQQTPPWQAR